MKYKTKSLASKEHTLQKIQGKYSIEILLKLRQLLIDKVNSC